VLRETEYQEYSARVDEVIERSVGVLRPQQRWLFRPTKDFEMESVGDIYRSHARHPACSVHLLHKHRHFEPCDVGDHDMHRYFVDDDVMESVRAIGPDAEWVK